MHRIQRYTHNTSHSDEHVRATVHFGGGGGYGGQRTFHAAIVEQIKKVIFDMLKGDAPSLT